MGERGPAKKPTALINLNNNAGHHAKLDLKNEPKPETVIPKIPPVLKGAARREWKRVTKWLEEHNLVSELDAQMLVSYCMAVQMRDSMWRVIQKSVVMLCSKCGTRQTSEGYCSECDDVTEPGLVLKGEEAYFYGRNSQTCAEYKAMTTASEQIVKIAAQFGMSPSSRSRMHVPEKEKKSSLAEKMKDANE